MKRVIYYSLFIVFFLLITNILIAQPPGLPSTPSQAPIDGGLSLLAAAGAGYAIKKLRDKRLEEL